MTSSASPIPKPTHARARAALRVETRAAVLSLVVGTLLLATKFTAYYLTKSTAIFSDALENIVNVLASCVALYSIKLAHTPADKNHPYGHGKVEFFSAGFEGGMIFLAAVLIAVQAVIALLSRNALEQHELTTGVVLIAAAMLANGILGVSLWQIGKRRSSLTLEADGLHLLTDAVTSAAVLTALVLIRFTGWAWVDPLTAVLVAAYIGWLGWGLIRRSWAGLMDEQDAADDRLLRSILDAHIGPAGAGPQICSYHKLRHRHSGRYHWVDFHIMVPSHWDIATAHRVASAIEYEIERALGEGNATAHVEPCAETGCANCPAARGGDGTSRREVREKMM